MEAPNLSFIVAADPGLPKYKYHALATPRHIRLLKINRNRIASDHFSSWTEIRSKIGLIFGEIRTKYHPIDACSVELIQLPLDKCPDFDCLSYAWGPPDVARYICLREGAILKTLALTSSLIRALPNLLVLCKTDYLWVDQICIQQDDTTEKVSQVTMMGELYARAQETFIWLDLEPKEIFRLLNLAERLRPFYECRSTEPDPADLQHYWEAVTPVSRLFSQPWWTRVWVIQEFVLSRQIAFCSATHVFDTSFISSAGMLMHHASQHLFHIRYYFSKTDRDRNDPTFILGLLDLALGYFHSTLPIDRLNAFMGLCDLRTFSVSYTKPATQLYTEFALSLAHETGSLAFLGRASSQTNLQDDSGQLPTWAPNWSTGKAWQIHGSFMYKQIRTILLDWTWHAVCHRRHHASLRLPKYASGRRILTARGGIIDTLANYSIGFDRSVFAELLGPHMRSAIGEKQWQEYTAGTGTVDGVNENQAATFTEDFGALNRLAAGRSKNMSRDVLEALGIHQLRYTIKTCAGTRGLMYGLLDHDALRTKQVKVALVHGCAAPVVLRELRHWEGCVYEVMGIAFWRTACMERG